VSKKIRPFLTQLLEKLIEKNKAETMEKLKTKGLFALEADPQNSYKIKCINYWLKQIS